MEADLAGLIMAGAAVLGVIVAAIVGIPSFLEWRMTRSHQEHTAKRRLHEAQRLLSRLGRACVDRWRLAEVPSETPSPEDLAWEAETGLLDALASNPMRKTKAEICFELGRLAHDRGDLGRAERELTTAIQSHRRLAAAYEERGLVR